MPIGDIASELLGGVMRAIGSIIVEVVFEIAIKSPGYLICRTIKKGIDPDGGWVIVAGLVFWVIIGVICYFAYSHFSATLAIDRCLDSGGAFNYQTKECIRS